MKSKLRTILDDLNYYKDYNFEKDVDERLKSTLERYLEELDNSYLRLKVKDVMYITKRLNTKWRKI